MCMYVLVMQREGGVSRVGSVGSLNETLMLLVAVSVAHVAEARFAERDNYELPIVSIVEATHPTTKEERGLL